MESAGESNGPPTNQSFKTQWLNLRRKRFWILLAVTLYTLLGFFVVPTVLKARILNLIQDDLGRSAEIDKIMFNPYTLNLGVRGFVMNDTDDERLAAVDELFINFMPSGLFRWAWTFSEIRLSGAFFYFEKLTTHSSRLSRLLSDLAARQPAQSQPRDSSWSFSINELTVEDGSLDLGDRSVIPAVNAGIRNLQIRLTGFGNLEGALSPLSLSGNLSGGGSFGLDGSLGVFPRASFEGEVQVHGIPLKLGQSYLQQDLRVLIAAGELDSDLEISVPAGKAPSLGGVVQVSGLEIDDATEGKRLLGWERLGIDRFELTPGSLQLSRVSVSQVFGRIVVLRDLSTNLSGLLIDKIDSAKPGAAGSADTPSKAFNIQVAGIQVDDSSMEFSDLSLPVPFATYISGLSGTISSIATNSSEPASVELEGQVDEYGLARIDGTINVLDPIQHTGLTLEFRNLLMSSISPYSVQFAGREISEGKLDLKLQYAIDEGALEGNNDIVISELLLGEKLDHPDAASLPLSLAVALLKDANGIIDIELPVSGDLNDPEFKIGGIVWKAFAGLITKAVSAPFRLLGKLIGIDSEDFGEFQFLPGRSDLTPPEMEKIAQLGQALQQRPQLAFEISGVTDPAIDLPALKSARLHAVVRERLDVTDNVDLDETMMLDVEVISVLEALFVERFPDTPLDAVKAEHSVAPSANPESAPVLDKLAYVAALRDRLLAAEPVSKQDLVDLAETRAKAIWTAFMADNQLDQDRIKLVKPGETKSEDGEWIKLDLSVATR